MSLATSIECILCSAPAELFGNPNFGRYRAIRCGNCGKYVLSESAADRIASLPDKFKNGWRTMIRSTQSDEILLIIVEPVGSGGNLKAERVPCSSLRL